jgi:prepilin-type N-terminal cleavage/methylation domain-containing protein
MRYRRICKKQLRNCFESLRCEIVERFFFLCAGEIRRRIWDVDGKDLSGAQREKYPARSRQRLSKQFLGFTLVETMVALLVLSLGMVAVSQCLSAALLMNVKANRTGVATAYAQTTLEEIRSSGQFTSQTTKLNDPALPQGSIQVSCTTYNAGLNLEQVAVTVSWFGLHTQLEQLHMVTVVRY